MFTGIVQDTAKLVKVTDNHDQMTMSFQNDQHLFKDVAIGDSVSVNGVCLTAITDEDDYFTANVMPITLDKTQLNQLRNNDIVNIETSMKIGDPIGGHIVQGHVNGIGKISNVQYEEDTKVITIEAAKNLVNDMIKQGSVAVDGISLTITDLSDHDFKVSITEHTKKITNLSQLEVNDLVNIETDCIGRYINSYLRKRDANGND